MARSSRNRSREAVTRRAYRARPARGTHLDSIGGGRYSRRMTGLRWGILATGGIAHAFARDLRTAGLDLRAVGSRRLEGARAFAEEFDVARVHGSYEALAADDDIDIVYIATPHPMHAENALLLLEHGKHVLIEKPFTLNVKSARAALDAVNQAGVVLGIDYQRRFHASISEIRNRVRDGSLGTLSCCVGELTTPSGPSLPKESWRVNPEETPAGALTALGVHLVDGFIDLCGEVDEVCCVNTRRASPLVDDTTVFTMRHKNGVTSTSTCSLASALSFSVSVYGARGIAKTTGPNMDTFQFIPVPDKGGGPASPQPEVIENKGFDPVKAALEAFASAVRGEAPYPIPEEQIIHGVAVFEAIVASANTGQPIKVR